MKRALLFLSLLAGSTNILAKDFGVEGHLFPIDEKDLRQVLTEKLKQNPNALKGINERLITSAKTPESVKNLAIAKSPRAFLYDPTFTVKMDIEDAKGKTLFKKGQKINPLEKVSLSSGLLFLNAEDEIQLKWAATHHPREYKWILIKGNPFTTEQQFRRSVYFDQGGALIKKLGIQAVPARVTQKNDRLLVEEISVKRANLCNGCTLPNGALDGAAT
ncbi:MAG: hypothetical protein K1000chlam3_00467 [Chlamydiae bacterium]|nr:hypothetical protein [Chlamydiota bacterium]